MTLSNGGGREGRGWRVGRKKQVAGGGRMERSTVVRLEMRGKGKEREERREPKWEGEKTRVTTACVLVRFERHDVFRHAFCFNFVEATNSRAFSPPFLSFSPVSSLMGTPRNVPRWFSALWMLLTIYPPSSSLSLSLLFFHPRPPTIPLFLSPPSTPLTPFLPSFPPSCCIPSPCTLSPPPLRVGEGLNRPVQSTTRSTTSLRISRVLYYRDFFMRCSPAFCRAANDIILPFVSFARFISISFAPVSVRQFAGPVTRGTYHISLRFASSSFH